MERTAPARALLGWLCMAFAISTGAQEPGAEVFSREVDMRLAVPPDEQQAYAKRLEDALARAGLSGLAPQYVVLVDRSPAVQAAFVYLRMSGADLEFVGASPASTGLPGTFDHFRTPLGVFEHSLANRDFRAEGTVNKNGIRGYGRKGMRVFDFGWAMAERGWKPYGLGVMRLQMHATDPDLLEKQLGAARSKGCIRIPASLDAFIDRHGLLDADYEEAAMRGVHLWVLPADYLPVQWPGRYLVVVDSGRKARPQWSPLPPKRRSGPARISLAEAC